ALIVQAELAEPGRAVADETGIATERRWSIDGAAAGFDRFEDRIAAPDVGPPPHDGPEPDDLLYLMYTSGTTGRPKGAMHTHVTTVAAGEDAVLAMDYRPGDRYLNVMPLFHVASLAMVNICLIRRCTMVLGR